jgi:hypothetical protein
VNKSFKNLLLSSVIAGTSLSAFAAGPDISGYFDVAFLAPKEKSSYFHQQHLNLILQHQVDKYKFFAELEFEDTPNIDYGRVPVDGAISGGKGRLFVERAYGEYSYSQYLNLRMGQMLTPTNYYLNHYPSIIVNYTNPLTLKTIFNYNEMGVQVFGEGSGFRYDAWTGKGPNTTKDTPEQNESGTNFGGKLSYTYDTKDLDMTVALIGASYSLGNHPAQTANAKKADMAMGAELTLSYKGFTLWSEYGTRDLKDKTTTLKNSMTGYYAIGSYTLSLGSQGELIPFVMVDGLKYKEAADDLEARQISRTILGFAYRPVPTITWKLEYENGGSYRPKKDGALVHIADANYVEDRVVAQFVYFYN